VQDYEPHFFPESDLRHHQAAASYTARPDVRAFCKTAWNAEVVRARTGRILPIVGPSVDVDRFRPGALQVDPGPASAPLRISALVRPSTPRRAAPLTIQVLAALKARFGTRVSVTVFGAADAELEKAGLVRESVRNLGPLNRQQVARVLQETDVFLDLSTFQAMGLTALEAMSSGCAVAVPANGGAGSFAEHEENALIVDTSDFEPSVAAAERLVLDDELRRRLRARAIENACRFYPEAAAFRVLDTLFGEG
jgi:glycosyltransferase involved in cell wall biosynthesis